MINLTPIIGHLEDGEVSIATRASDSHIPAEHCIHRKSHIKHKTKSHNNFNACDHIQIILLDQSRTTN